MIGADFDIDGVMNVSDKQACTQQEYKVKRADLPASCPPRDDRIWDAHPRVYLDVEQHGEVECPYCSAIYKLVD